MNVLTAAFIIAKGMGADWSWLWLGLCFLVDNFSYLPVVIKKKDGDE